MPRFRFFAVIIVITVLIVLTGLANYVDALDLADCLASALPAISLLLIPQAALATLECPLMPKLHQFCTKCGVQHSTPSVVGRKSGCQKCARDDFCTIKTAILPLDSVKPDHNDVARTICASQAKYDKRPSLQANPSVCASNVRQSRIYCRKHIIVLGSGIAIQ
jgi:hypothetical protein